MRNPLSTNAQRVGAAISLLVLVTIAALWLEGRIWTCACGSLAPWAGETESMHNSQHLFDPYSFTHILHGVLFCGACAWLLPRMPARWRFVLALLVEVAWEVAENSPFIINRYREATFALGYEGDSILNSVGDLLSCAFGFGLAGKIGLRWSAALFVFLEVALLFWIKDNLTLNIIMLVHPIDAIKAWQLQP